MDELQTMVRTRVAVNGGSFLLEQGGDVEDLKRRIEAALHAGGEFVDFAAAGDRTVSILISSGSGVVISVETVQFEPHDSDDDVRPFAGMLDLL